MTSKNAYKHILVMLNIVFTAVIIMVTGCSHENKRIEEKIEMPAYMKSASEDRSENGVLTNYLINMNLSGETGKILSAHEETWVKKILEDNPGLFEGFENPDNAEISKTMWHGEFPGKILTGLAQMYITDRSGTVLDAGNQFVAYLKDAQREDGYLGPWPDNARFNKDSVSATEGAWGKWDTWGHYHCIYGLYRWYQVTGNQEALVTAKKALDCIYTYFIDDKNTFVSQKWAECNFAISHMFTLMYELTNENKYLEAAQYIVNEEWGYEYLDFYSKRVIAADWLNSALNGTVFGRSNQPRWESLYTLSTLGPLYKATSNDKYLKAFDALWWGMAGYDRHNTGSFGTGEGASGNPYGTMSETCNTVAWTQLSVDYLKLSKNSYVADELELSYYNATLGSLNGDNKIFSYANYSDGNRDAANVTLAGHSYINAPDMSCCQASGTRGLSSITEWAVLTDKSGLYLNYYGESKLETYTASGNLIALTQETVYPEQGNVRITVDAKKAEAFTLFIRIPVWSADTTIKLNGEKIENAAAGSYCKITKQWDKNDIIEIGFDMSLHFWAAEKNSGLNKKTSVYYGPLLLAAEENGGVKKTMKISFGQLANYTRIEDENAFISFKVKSTIGKDIILKDYAHAGKNGERFFSWLSITEHSMEPFAYTKGGTPQWCGR